jgi:hypothetical protein
MGDIKLKIAQNKTDVIGIFMNMTLIFLPICFKLAP